MKVEKIYIIRGNTGEYSDFFEWDVAAFNREVDALYLKESLNAVLVENELHRSCDRIANIDDFNHPLDPNCHVDYTGTNYTMTPMELRGCIRKVK